MLHLIKLCVGVDSVEELARWQKQRLAEKKSKGQIAARQKLLALRPLTREGVPHCGLVYDKKLVPVVRRPRAAFQGWRYLDPKDAPADVSALKGAKGLPEAIQQELAALGLL